MDTTYLLPLAGIRVKKDLLKAIAEKKVDLEFGELKVSLISIFELQAKASKIGIPPERVSEAIDVVFNSFEVVPFYRSDVVKKAHELRELVPDYIDCVVVATAICLNEGLVTEDELVHRVKKELKRRYGLAVARHDELIRA